MEIYTVKFTLIVSVLKRDGKGKMRYERNLGYIVPFSGNCGRGGRETRYFWVNRA